jgi:twitching motility two-component system response regulator PilH
VQDAKNPHEAIRTAVQDALSEIGRVDMTILAKRPAPYLVCRKRILIVEDDADVRELYDHVLKKDGFDVYHACDGVVALRLADLISFDLFVLDIGLPRLGGTVVRDQLAASSRTRDIPIVIVTASEMDAGRLRADRVLRKPFHLDVLATTVRSVLAGKGDLNVPSEGDSL